VGLDDGRDSLGVPGGRRWVVDSSNERRGTPVLDSGDVAVLMMPTWMMTLGWSDLQPFGAAEALGVNTH